jgi:hypothetical protein
MPLTALQKQILRVLAANRSEESHFAGGLVLNRGGNGVRSIHVTFEGRLACMRVLSHSAATRIEVESLDCWRHRPSRSHSSLMRLSWQPMTASLSSGIRWREGRRVGRDHRTNRVREWSRDELLAAAGKGIRTFWRRALTSLDMQGFGEAVLGPWSPVSFTQGFVPFAPSRLRANSRSRDGFGLV